MNLMKTYEDSCVGFISVYKRGKKNDSELLFYRCFAFEPVIGQQAPFHTL